MITSTEPQVALNGRYSVTEASRMLGIHRTTLNKYTEEGKIKCGFRRLNGRKFYEGREILRVWKSVL